MISVMEIPLNTLEETIQNLKIWISTREEDWIKVTKVQLIALNNCVFIETSAELKKIKSKCRLNYIMSIIKSER